MSDIPNFLASTFLSVLYWPPTEARGAHVKSKQRWTWWCVAIVLALGMLRSENRLSLGVWGWPGDTMRIYLNNKHTNPKLDHVTHLSNSSKFSISYGLLSLACSASVTHTSYQSSLIDSAYLLWASGCCLIMPSMFSPQGFALIASAWNALVR